MKTETMSGRRTALAAIFAASMAAALCPALAGAPAQQANTAPSAPETVDAASFRIRDPFILPDGGTYYLYESRPWSGGRGVWVRTSKDLKTWSAKKLVLDVIKDFPAKNIWAPEVHKYNGEYWMFVTLTFKKGYYPVAAPAKDLKRQTEPRGTWIFRAAKPDGPFEKVAAGPVPPRDWMTLDGTLVVDGGAANIVFCHEWVQTGDGTICRARLSQDFASLDEEPVEMLTASHAMEGAGIVTDGPFFWRSEKNGALHMIWSNFIKGQGYSVLARTSESGSLAGPWSADRLLTGGDGGHGMIFKTFEGALMLALHRPNTSPGERMALIELEDDGKALKIKESSRATPRPAR